MIVASAVGVLVLGYLNSIIVPRKTPRLRLFIGVGILYFILATVAQVNSKLARNFSLLVLLTAFLAEGGGALNWLLGRGSHDSLGLSGTGTPNIPPVSTNVGTQPATVINTGQGPVVPLQPTHTVSGNLSNTVPGVNFVLPPGYSLAASGPQVHSTP